MSVNKNKVLDLNKMNVYSQRAKLGSLLLEALDGGGGGGSSGDMLKSEYANNPKSDDGYVNASIVADKWTNSIDVSFIGDITGFGQIDGSKNINISLSIPKTGVKSGTYTKVAVNDKGQVTNGDSATVDDIIGLGTAAKKNIGTNPGEIPVLNSDGKLDLSLVPIWIGTQEQYAQLTNISPDILYIIKDG